jgi:hypothetical protein
MRKPLTDSLCAELAKDFKPFKVRRNGLKPLSGFKTSTTFKVISLRKNALHQWVVRFATSKNDWLAENFDMIVEKQAEPKQCQPKQTFVINTKKRMVKGLSENGFNIEGEYAHTDNDGFIWVIGENDLIKLVAIESEPIQVKAQQIDDKLKQIDLTPTEPHPDNQTVNALVQYVSEHKQSMSKESILHFANLIGLIKLGAL